MNTEKREYLDLSRSKNTTKTNKEMEAKQQ